MIVHYKANITCLLMTCIMISIGCDSAEVPGIAIASSNSFDSYKQPAIADGLAQSDTVTSIADAFSFKADLVQEDVTVTVDSSAADVDKTSVSFLFDQACARDVKCGSGQTVDECLIGLSKLYNSGSILCKSALYDTMLYCQPDVSTPCQKPNGDDCDEAHANFQKYCLDPPRDSHVEEVWKDVCAEFEKTEMQDCSEDADVSVVVDMCEFIAVLLLDTEYCMEKIESYLECIPNMAFYCPPQQLVPVPKEPNPCEEVSLAFTFPGGECIN